MVPSLIFWIASSIAARGTRNHSLGSTGNPKRSLNSTSNRAAPKSLCRRRLERVPVDIQQFEFPDDFHVGQKIGRVFLGVGNAAFHVASGHADLVNEIAVLRDEGMFRLAPEHVNVTRRQIALVFIVRKKRPEARLGDDAAAGLVLVQGPLQGTEQKVALCAVVVNDSQSAVRPAIVADKTLAQVGNHDFLAVEDEVVAFGDLRILLVLYGLPFTRLQFALHIFKERFEFLEILAGIALGDFLRGFDFLSRTHMAVVLLRRVFQRGGNFVPVGWIVVH